MLASRIFTIGKKSGQGCRTGIEGEVSSDSDFVEGPNDQRREFFGFCRLLFCETQKLWGRWNPLLFLFHLALLRRLNKLITSWNDRRSRRVFLCFYLAIFKLMKQSWRLMLISIGGHKSVNR